MRARNNVLTGYSSRLFLLFAGLFWLLQASANEQDARGLLDEMTNASRSLSYEGVFIYQRGKQLETMRIIHRHDDQGHTQERLVSLTGHAREVIRNDDSVTCIFPDDEAVLVEKNRPGKLLSAQIPQPVTRLADNYAFSMAGKDRVAGRDSWIVSITPRDQFRYGYQIWIDDETRLMLKSELKDQQGETLERIMFTDISIVEYISDSALQPALTGNGFTWYESPPGSGQPGANGGWEVQWLPKGFSMSNHTHRRGVGNATPSQHMVFSDGMAMVSVFVEQVDEQHGLLIGPSSVGAVNAFARQTGGFQIIAVGDVPQTTVRMIADSVTHNR